MELTDLELHRGHGLHFPGLGFGSPEKVPTLQTFLYSINKSTLEK